MGVFGEHDGRFVMFPQFPDEKSNFFHPVPAASGQNDSSERPATA